MLFDLRSKGRRRTVQGVYLGLALLMGGGLVLFGVGAGNGFGGILNAFSGSGNGGTQHAQISSQEKTALAQTKAQPNNPAAWTALMQARYVSAGQGSNFNSATGTYSAGGKAEMAAATQAWQHYLTLTKKPDPNMAIVAARAYDAIAQYKNEIAAWQIVTAANPTVPTYYEDLAVAAYQAKNASLGDLAAAKAVDLAPKSTQIQLRSELKTLRTQALGAAATSTPTTTAGTTTTAPSTTTTPTKAKSKTGKKK
jgi:hypothetical protein